MCVCVLLLLIQYNIYASCVCMCVWVCTCVRVHNRDCNTSTGILCYFDDDDENDAIRAPSAKKSIRITVVGK